MNALAVRIAVSAICIVSTCSFSVDLNTPFLRVSVTGTSNSTCVSALSFALALAGEPAGAWTPNLLFSGDGTCGGAAAYFASSSALETLAAGPNTTLLPTGGTVASVTNTSVDIRGINLGGGVAMEDWNISIAGGALSWTIRRTFLVAGTAVSDQMPALAFLTTAGTYLPGERRHSAGRVLKVAPDWHDALQMPSFSYVDDGLLDASTGMAYRVRGGAGLTLLGDAAHGGSRRLLLSPAGVAMLVNHSDCRFAFTRPVDIFVNTLAVGAECAAGPASTSGYLFAAGDVKSTTLVAELLPAPQGHAVFNFSVPTGSPAAFVAQQAAICAKIFQVPSGFINGNSPACETCLHEMAIFPQMEGIYSLQAPAVEPSAAGIVPQPPVPVHAGTKHFFDFVLNASVSAEGLVAPRWSVDGGNDWSFGGIMDQYPNFILTAYYYGASTGDRVTIASWMPTLDRIATYMLENMGVGNTSLLTNTFPDCNGTWGVPLTAGPPLADNWFDDVRFGWHDALVGMYAVESFRALGDVKTWLGDSSANTSYAIHKKMVAAYNARYWDESAGIYHDWVDINGVPRTYFYVWHQYLAIEYGIASPTQAAAIMATADEEYARIRTTYNMTAAQLWCVPCNFRTLNHSDLTCAFDGEDNYGHYENGACFYAHTGFETLALSRTLGPDAAFERFAGAMAVFNETRFWSQRHSWLDGIPMGTDVATENFFIVWCGLFSSLGVRVSLLGGLEVIGPAATALEGASLTLGVLGKDIVVQVKNGRAVVLNLP